MNNIENIAEFRTWVRVQLAYKDMSQNDLAKKFNVPPARISEATHGKKSGLKYILPIIQELGGDIRAFKDLMINSKLEDAYNLQKSSNS